MNTQKTKRLQRQRRRNRIRARVVGLSDRPRLSVYRSRTGIFAQVIDDVAGKTLVSVNAKEQKACEAGERKGKVQASYCLGVLIAEKAKAKGIIKVVFDRGGYQYHGRVAAFAEGARAGGLQF